MSEPIELPLDDCGCCETGPAPRAVSNRPGLPALSYRLGTYASFLRRMLGRIGTFTLQDGDFAGTRPLATLTTRQPDDPSIALLDASAVVADVLTFYQERIANEGFLRTAAERRSVLEMARQIGYELNPGVAATACLAFTVEDAPGAPGLAGIPAGTQVKSLPPPGGFPQTFETAAAFTAHKEWNALRPRLTQPQDLTGGVSGLYLRGTSSNLKAGDLVLLTSSIGFAAVHVKQVEIDSPGQVTHVTFDHSTPALGGLASPVSYVVWGDQKVPFDDQAIQQEILGKTWTDADLNAFLQANEWDPQALVDYLSDRRSRVPGVNGWAHVLRARAGIFGNNAPRYDSLPVSQRFGEWAYTDSANQNNKQFKAAAYPSSWEGRNITTDSQGTALSGVSFYLDRSLPAALPGGYVLLEQGASFGLYIISAAIEASLSDYAMSGKVTGLTVSTPFVSPALTAFTVRAATVHLQNEPLDLAELPITTDLAAGTAVLELDSFVLGLQPGQPVALFGERADADGRTASEILTVKSVSHAYGLTTVTFEGGPAHPYKRATLTLNANTVRATHGETVTEILGSGDGARGHQTFGLKKPPLTFTPAATPSGSESTLQLRVDGLLWDPAVSLYGLGPADRRYIVRIDDDARAALIFGDGQAGARLPTGQNNLTAVYRSGIGLAGEVAAGSLTLMPSRPPGVRSAVNPLAASGGGDPEKLDDARRHAPLTVRTLDRIVSLQDYEDFAAAFAGIGKAQAVELWNGENRLVHLTIAGENGEPIGPGDFRANFLEALDRARDPSQQVRVDSFEKLLFDLQAALAVERTHVAGVVLEAARSALRLAFSFPNRSFGQPATAAEVLAVLQGVDGVVFVDLNLLHLSEATPTLEQVLPAGVAAVSGGSLQLAQLLQINDLGIQLLEVQE